jgi:AAA+ ATPase superfamily predicted ATPase
MPRINPFKPQSPVNPGMFTGRIPEIKRLENHFFQTKNGQPSNFIISGERGIGKSSLLLVVKAMAEGLIEVGKQKLKFLVIDTDIDHNTTQLALIKKIELGLTRELGKTETAKKFLSEAWDFLQRVEVGGIKINPKSELSLDDITFDKFTFAFADTANRVTTVNETSIFNVTYDGIVILIDEADRASDALQLGSFLKLFTERLQRNGCSKVMIGLAGLPDLRNILLSSHESSLRVFDEMLLDRLSKAETNQVIGICLEKAGKDNETPTTITDEGRDFLINFSEGYPHFIQQFGYSAFDNDKDNKIDEDDVIGGALGEHGALELIGARYYRDSFYNKIQKESYRQILRIMANNLSDWITKSEIRAQFKGNDSVLKSAIKALRERHIILAKEGERGVYRLQHTGFALWIKFKTTDPSKLQNALETGPNKS